MSCDHEQACLTCRFFSRATDDSELGECRRHAPSPTVFEDAELRNVDALWPQVLIEEWCGEWEPKTATSSRV
jgi:hypothetical protein